MADIFKVATLASTRGQMQPSAKRFPCHNRLAPQPPLGIELSLSPSHRTGVIRHLWHAIRGEVLDREPKQSGDSAGRLHLETRRPVLEDGMCGQRRRRLRVERQAAGPDDISRCLAELVGNVGGAAS